MNNERLVLIAECCGEFAEWDIDIHQVEYMFECHLLSLHSPINGYNPDETQIGVEWVDLHKLIEIRIYPSILKELISSDGTV